MCVLSYISRPLFILLILLVNDLTVYPSYLTMNTQMIHAIREVNYRVINDPTLYLTRCVSYQD